MTTLLAVLYSYIDIDIDIDIPTDSLPSTALTRNN
jgi:hypothetical protein